MLDQEPARDNILGQYNTYTIHKCHQLKMNGANENTWNQNSAYRKNTGLVKICDEMLSAKLSPLEWRHIDVLILNESTNAFRSIASKGV